MSTTPIDTAPVTTPDTTPGVDKQPVVKLPTTPAEHTVHAIQQAGVDLSPRATLEHLSADTLPFPGSEKMVTAELTRYSDLVKDGGEYGTDIKELMKEIQAPAGMMTPKEQLMALLASDRLTPDEKAELRETLAAPLSGFDADTHTDTYNKFLKNQWLPQESLQDAVDTPASVEATTPPFDKSLLTTPEGIDTVLAMIQDRQKNFVFASSRSLDNIVSKLNKRKTLLQHHAPDSPTFKQISEESIDEFFDALQKEEIIPYVFTPENPTLDTQEGISHFIDDIKSRMLKSTGADFMKWSHLRSDLYSLQRNKSNLDPASPMYQMDRADARELQEQITKKLIEEGLIQKPEEPIKEKKVDTYTITGNPEELSQKLRRLAQAVNEGKIPNNLLTEAYIAIQDKIQGRETNTTDLENRLRDTKVFDEEQTAA